MSTPDPSVDLSVVIPFRTALPQLVEQLEALSRQKPAGSWEVVIADNGSGSDLHVLVDAMAARLPQLTIIDASDRRGAAHARNVGVRAARGEFVCFVDADDVVDDGWLAALETALADHDFVACQIDHERLNDILQRTARGLKQCKGLFDWYGTFLKFSGSGTLAVRRALHEQVGGFDETFVRGGEDQDYCWRIQTETGAVLHFVPDAVIAYRYRFGLRGTFRQARDYGAFHVHLYRKWRNRGLQVPMPQWRAGFWSWIRVLASIRLVRSRPDFANWLWRVGQLVGMAEESIKLRTLLLAADPVLARTPGR